MAFLNLFRLVGRLNAVLFNVNKVITATISWISCLNTNASYWSVKVSRYGIPFFRENCLLVGNKLCLLAVTSIHGMCVACQYSNYCNVCRNCCAAWRKPIVCVPPPLCVARNAWNAGVAAHGRNVLLLVAHISRWHTRGLGRCSKTHAQSVIFK